MQVSVGVLRAFRSQGRAFATTDRSQGRRGVSGHSGCRALGSTQVLKVQPQRQTHGQALQIGTHPASAATAGR